MSLRKEDGYGDTRLDDVEIVQEQNRLAVRGKLKDSNGTTYLHRGIAARAFDRHFDRADYVEVTDATLGEGLLVISSASCPRR